jgi:hypothetical protein
MVMNVVQELNTQGGDLSIEDMIADEQVVIIFHMLVILSVLL